MVLRTLSGGGHDRVKKIGAHVGTAPHQAAGAAAFDGGLALAV
jgi:hypothetical protein